MAWYGTGVWVYCRRRCAVACVYRCVQPTARVLVSAVTNCNSVVIVGVPHAPLLSLKSSY